MKRFIVIEGLDGIGKSTQIKLLQDFFKKRKIPFKHLHFPRTQEGIFGGMIAQFLRGEYGDVHEVNPYLVALIYAEDRNQVKNEIKRWLKDNYLLIVDRYTYSNMAFQCAKIADPQKKERLKKWIEKLEYDVFKIPKPIISIYLHVTFDFLKHRLNENRKGKDRAYLLGNSDIHETNLSFQKEVEKEYLQLIQEKSDFCLINCFSDDGQTLSPKKINEKIIEILKKKKILHNSQEKNAPPF